MSHLGPALDRLLETIRARQGADPAQSYTASLIAAGPARCAKKLGEEAVETVIAASTGDRAGLIAETADLLYHLLVTLHVGGVSLDEVAASLEARKGQSGHAEKAGRAEG